MLSDHISCVCMSVGPLIHIPHMTGKQKSGHQVAHVETLSETDREIWYVHAVETENKQREESNAFFCRDKIHHKKKQTFTLLSF